MKTKIRMLVATAVVAALLAWMGMKLIHTTHDSRSGTVASTASVMAYCPDRRPEPMKVLGIDRAREIAFHRGHLVALDERGRIWSYYLEETTSCDARAVQMSPGRYATKNGEADTSMRHITTSAKSGLGIASNDMLVTWEPSEGRRICAPGFGGGMCGLFLKKEVTDVREVSGSASHLLLVTDDGGVLSGGMNDCGQLGRVGWHSPSEALFFGRVPGLSSIVAVATGKRSSMALTKDGKVWTWGNLSHPLIGSAAPSAPTADFIYCGRDLSGPAEAVDATPDIVPGLPPIAAISSYYGFDLALDRQGRVWGWGFNDCGQIGDNPSSLGHFQDKPALIDGLPPIAAIAAGARHALYLGVDGSVWGTGDNEFSQLAMPKGLPTNRPICVSSTRRAGVDGYFEKPHRIEGFGRAIAIAADDSHSAAIDADGHVWTWGRFP